MDILKYFSISLILLLISFSVFSLNADFNANNTSACKNLYVNFTSTSTGSIISYKWNFGDGSTGSNQQNPTHFYQQPGNYTVTLIVFSNSSSDTLVKTNYIKVFAAPVVSITQNTKTGCLPLQINFTDNTTAGSIGLSSWFWDFGDGQNSNLQNPSHIYNTAGSFNVALFVKDSNNCSSEINLLNHITVTNNPIEANFTIDNPNACYIPHNVNLTNTTVDLGFNYSWNFGNGNTSNDQNPSSQVYTQFGTFNVKLNVSNNAGCKDSIIKTVLINEFIADFSIDTIKGCDPFNAQFTDLSQATISWNWEFDDGGIATIKNPAHIFVNSGSYTVTLIAADSNCIDTISKTFDIIVFPKPTVNFIANDTTLCQIPSIVNYTYTGSSVVSYNWNFGNSLTSIEQNPQTTYNNALNYSVTLSVIDENNCSNIKAKTNYISIVLPESNFTFDVFKGCKPLAVNFTDISTSFENIDYWEWNFGDGTANIFTQNPNHIYADTGVYDVTLIIRNVDGCTDTLIINDAISVGDNKLVNFSPLDSIGCYKFNLTFNDLSSSVADEWLWDFGDGANSTQQNPSHTYADTGYFDVSLIVGFHGCYDTLRVDSVVLVRPPIAKFSADALIGCEFPHDVNFTDESVLADSWMWDFGDNQTYNGQTPPTHTYTQPGFYNVWIFAENTGFNCTDSTMLTVKISDINVGFYPDTIRGCQPFICNFTDTSYVNTSKVAWTWSFGDGGTSSIQNPTYTYLNSGTYDVHLKVTDELGCKDSLTILTLIEVKQLPTLGFISDVVTGCVPLEVNFSDTSTAQVPIVSWNWTFGDSNSGNSQATSNIYNQRGQYSVTLSIIDENNCTNSVTKTNYIKATIPYPNFTFSNVICNNQTANFTNTSSPTTTGDILTYIWNFGDGSSPSTDINPTHNYTVISDTSVSFNVFLTATDENACDSTISKPITISIPQAFFTPSETNATCPPFYVTMSDNSLSIPGSVTNWSWNFGDNTNNSTIQNSTHSYFNAGIFDVTLIIKNNYGCVDTLKKDSLIKVNGPSGSISYSVDVSTCVPVFIFYAVSQNSVNSIWIFDDGYVGSGDTTNHSYYIPGSYEPVLILQDALGCQDEVEIDNPIFVSFPTVDLILNSTDALCQIANGTANVIASGANAPYNYLWSNNQTNDTIIGLLPGMYRITVTDDVGCPGVDSVLIGQILQSFSNSFAITNEICTSVNGTIQSNPSLGNSPYKYLWSNNDTLNLISNLSFGIYYVTISDSLGCLKLDSAKVLRDSLTFISNMTSTDAMCKGKNGTANVSPSDGIEPYMYSWSNGFISDLIISLDTGKYFVTISDLRGCIAKDSAIISNSVNNTINASLVSDTNKVLAVLPILFTSTSVDSIEIVKWTWTIDGIIYPADTLGYRSHQFEYSGIYEVKLLIEDKLGCIDSAKISITILDGLEVPNVFSPNGDGINDVFYIHHSGIEEYEIQIFNRWGALLFTETAPKIWWTGRTTAGVEVPTGTYFYLIKAKSVTGTDYELKGSISLFR